MARSLSRRQAASMEVARIISPPRDQLATLRTRLSAGEQLVLDFFDAHLPPRWEIYVQPYLNGLRPDFVLLNPDVGIAVFEVKDWNLDALDYRVERGVLWATDAQGKDFRPEDPIAKVKQYKDEILELYCPRLSSQYGSAAVTAGLIITASSSEKAARLLGPLQEQWPIQHREYYPICGRDALEGEAIQEVFPEATRRHSLLMSEDLAHDLRSWLVEPAHSAQQREPLKLNPVQTSYATTRTDAGYRRIKGPAGSGKSAVLAARAALLALEGHEVLVVSFNVTLLHYLRDLAVRYPVPGSRSVNKITWLHFHKWGKRVCFQAGMGSEYNALWHTRSLEDGLDVDLTEVDDFPEATFLDLVSRALSKEGAAITRYDAVLVDEGQDFTLESWNLLRKVCQPDGEMILVADQTQDIYGRTTAWTDEKMTGAGFRGDWARLEGSYRTPEELVPHLRRYLSEHLV